MVVDPIGEKLGLLDLAKVEFAEAGEVPLTKSDFGEEREERPSSHERLASREARPGSDEDAPGPGNSSTVFRFVGLGSELAGFTLVIAGLGYLFDSTLQLAKPFGTALGALIGFTLGMVRFIQQVKNVNDN